MCTIFLFIAEMIFARGIVEAKEPLEVNISAQFAKKVVGKT